MSYNQNAYPSAQEVYDQARTRYERIKQDYDIAANRWESQQRTMQARLNDTWRGGNRKIKFWSPG